MVIKNKHGWIRILEAVIAILLIASVLTFVYFNKIYNPNKEESIAQLQAIILDEIAENNELRNQVLLENVGYFETYLEDKIPSYLGYAVDICEVDDICNNAVNLEDYVGRDIFVDERIITSNIDPDPIYSPKKIKLFIWEK